MYAAAVLMVYVMYRKDNFKLSFNLMEAAFIGFVLAWFISILAAYDVREAVGDALRNLNYLIIFFFWLPWRKICRKCAWPYGPFLLPVLGWP